MVSVAFGALLALGVTAFSTPAFQMNSLGMPRGAWTAFCSWLPSVSKKASLPGCQVGDPDPQRWAQPPRPGCAAVCELACLLPPASKSTAVIWEEHRAPAGISKHPFLSPTQCDHPNERPLSLLGRAAHVLRGSNRADHGQGSGIPVEGAGRVRTLWLWEGVHSSGVIMWALLPEGRRRNGQAGDLSEDGKEGFC